MVTLDDYEGAIRDILEGQGIASYTTNELQYKLFTGGIISTYMLSILGRDIKRYFALSDTGVTANAEFCVGLAARGDGKIDGVFRFIFSKMLITIGKPKDFFDETKGETMMHRFAKAAHISFKYVAKAGGVVCDIIIPEVFHTKSQRAFKEMKRVGRGHKYSPIDIDTSWMLTSGVNDATRIYDKVASAIRVKNNCDGSLFECQPAGARFSGDMMRYELLFEDAHLAFRNPATIDTLHALGMTHLYVEGGSGKVKTVLHFEEEQD